MVIDMCVAAGAPPHPVLARFCALADDAPTMEMWYYTPDATGRHYIVTQVRRREAEAVLAMIEGVTPAMWTAMLPEVLRVCAVVTDDEGIKGMKVVEVISDSKNPDSRIASGYMILGALYVRSGAAMPEDLLQICVDQVRHCIKHWRLRNNIWALSRIFHYELLLQCLVGYDVRGGTFALMALDDPIAMQARGGSLYSGLQGDGKAKPPRTRNILTRGHVSAEQQAELDVCARSWLQEDGKEARCSADLLEPPYERYKLFAAMKRVAWAQCASRVFLSPDLVEKVARSGGLSLGEADLIPHFPKQLSGITVCLLEGSHDVVVSVIKVDAKMINARAEETAARAAAKRLRLENAGLAGAIACREAADGLFANGEFYLAMRKYEDALQAPHVETDDELLACLHSRAAQACIRIGAWDWATFHAQRALKVDEEHGPGLKWLKVATAQRPKGYAGDDWPALESKEWKDHPWRVAVGDDVEIFGLQSETGMGLNGRMATVECFVKASGRFRVVVPSLGKEFCAKPTNLRKLRSP